MRKTLFVFSLFLSFSTAEAAYLDLAWDLNQEPDLAGYRIYYGASSGDYINFVDVGLTTAYRLDNLLEDVTFFIAVTAYDLSANESEFSEEVSGVGVIDDSFADVNELRTGEYTGEGKKRTFRIEDIFNAGDEVIIRSYVIDEAALPVAHATVEISVNGPENITLLSDPSDTDGLAEAKWKTSRPRKKGGGGTARGFYTAKVTNVTADGNVWDGVQTQTTFVIE